MRKIHCSFRSSGLGIVLIIIVAIISTCQSQIPPTESADNGMVTSSPHSTDDWAKRWLKGIPCHVPCWEGIIPGQTSATQAMERLQHSPIIGAVHIERTKIVPDLGYVIWQWKDGTEGGSALFHASSPSEEIYLISSALPAEFKLAEVSSIFGQPTHIVATAGRSPEGGDIHKDLRIVFANHGFYLPTKVIPITLDGNVVTLAPVFFAATDEDPSEALKVAPEFVVPWQGPKAYEFYCRDLEGGSACGSK